MAEEPKTEVRKSSWEEAFKLMQHVSRKLDKLEPRARARAIAWLVEKYADEHIAEGVLESVLEREESSTGLDPNTVSRSLATLPNGDKR